MFTARPSAGIESWTVEESSDKGKDSGFLCKLTLGVSYKRK